MHHGSGTGKICRGRLISGVATWGYEVSALHLTGQSLLAIADILQ
jgi:hypothetical protein